METEDEDGGRGQGTLGHIRAVKRPAGAAGLLISMMERQLHSQGGIEKGKLCLS